MYEGHFQLERRPFAATPDPGCCYLSPTQTPLLQTVRRCIENGQGIAILTGTAGIGKTLLAQVLLSESADRFTPVYLGTGQFPTRRALLQAILYELGQPYGGMTDQELRLELHTALRNLISQRDGLLLILDEAHLLSDRLLEEIRLLADLAQHGVPLMRVVLCGNPEFEERLTSPALAAFNQRVACHVVLETLTQQESISYLQHRIQWAGGDVDRLFEPAALQLIAYASDGVPRCLNQLADHSLMQAYLSGSTMVSAAIVRQALADLQHLALRWNPSALHERSTRNITPTTDIPETRADAFEPSQVIETDDSETACFEFGAGDNSSMVAAEPALVDLPDERISQLALPVDEPAVFEFGSDSETDTETEPEASDDEDGPPLFPWLAKPAAAEAAPQSSGDFCSSSFNIRTRGRVRTPAIEHEVVSTAPLKGSELSGKRSFEALRVPTPIKPRPMLTEPAFPAEEAVVDSYARLDASLTPMFPRPAPTLPVPEFISESPAESIEINATEAGGILEPHVDGKYTEPQSSLTEAIHKAVRTDSMNQPLDRIDAIYALIDEADAASPNAANCVELITDYGIERIDVDLPANAELPPGVAADLPIDLEDWIGSTVVEVGRDLQKNMAASFPELVNRQRTNKLEQLLDGIERASRFDVVEPDASGETPHARVDQPAEAVASAEGSGVVPPPNYNYKNFFSGLRRRQLR